MLRIAPLLAFKDRLSPVKVRVLALQRIGIESVNSLP
jgi:hypothetical protein